MQPSPAPDGWLDLDQIPGEEIARDGLVKPQCRQKAANA
jgi:hypothetical protein